MSIEVLVYMLIAFFLGSIPFGIIIAKIRGIDLRKVGSGNIGATNVLRSLGKWPAVITLLGDILKGTVAVAMGRFSGVGPFFEGLIGIAAILGHNFSIFLGFRGGKGVATSFGVLSIYAPLVAALTFIVWLSVVISTKYSSMGALVSFGILPLTMVLLDGKEKLFISVLIAGLIFIRHRENIQRLIKGTERKIGRRE
ncbi:MAG: glycerol-3-phosphate 1-O-acyltransferase PlsY [Nitrospirota bacterium]